MKVRDVIVLKEVADDLNDGRAFYDQIQAGVGDYFWDSLIADIESLILYSGIHSKKYGFYRMYAKRFPYAVYYDVKDEIATIVAVLPMRRDPEWIKQKLKKRR